ncbi:hypothetical protein SSX86_031866 [Deinandra increscens subsp. villosa]|uniref:Protein FAR1-RELATED SEQUENCE n=1 Tax=Deinandra increscens subsp. villosa TaxID=3103831 RepID=A0AAP0GHU1_9ASTR
MQNTDVRAQLHRLVWSNYNKTTTFERKWAGLIEAFGLGGNDWLAEMYGIRERWIPAYFRDIPMSCLLKTTSVCESSNVAFKVSSTSAHTLVQFMLCFETRLESQRYKQRAADFKTSSISYYGNMELPIQRHAFDVYTQTIFGEVEKEINEGRYYCYISNTDVSGSEHVYSVSQRSTTNAVVYTFEVKFDALDQKTACSCRSDEVGMSVLAEKLRELRKEVVGVGSGCLLLGNSESKVVEELVGQSMNVDVAVANPIGVRTKGCGRKRRITGPGEKATNKPPKAPRQCKNCMLYVTDHDSRNCKMKKKGGDELEDVDSGSD